MTFLGIRQKVVGRKIDDLAAKVDQLLKNNQNQIYVMEETNLNQVLQLLQQKPRHRKNISKRSATSMGTVGSSKTTTQTLM
ncbi:hypothetical protein F2Q69_00041884 [Brassica cretica]|uniref:Uncharacterized protein n=1 Tax=Brassica cretica TaxID=69181 RepID=A0A8S9NE17_BRACR|nr:hypothetical protein F2Q69_00041884 [Brassica cretica]